MSSLDDLFLRIWSTDSLRAIAESGDSSGLLDAINQASIETRNPHPIRAVDLLGLLGQQRATALATALQQAAAASPVVALIVQGFAANGFDPTSDSHRAMISSLTTMGILSAEDRDSLLSLATRLVSVADLSLGRPATAEDVSKAIAWVAMKNGVNRAIGYRVTSIARNANSASPYDRVAYCFELASGATAGPFIVDRPPATDAEHDAWVGLQALAYNGG